MKIDSFKLDFINGFIEFLTLKINCTYQNIFFFIFDVNIIIIFLHYRFYFFFFLNLNVILIKKNTVYKNV